MSKTKNLGVPCCEQVHNSFGVGFHQCQRFAVLVRDKRVYCKQHDPVAVEARQQASHEKYAADEARRKADRIRTIACIRACVGIPTEELDPGLVKRLLSFFEDSKND